MIEKYLFGRNLLTNDSKPISFINSNQIKKLNKKLINDKNYFKGDVLNAVGINLK